MIQRRFPYSLSVLIALTLLSSAAAARPDRSGPKNGRKVYLVQLTAPPLALYRGGVPGLVATDPRVRGERKLDAGSADSLLYLDHLLRQQDETLALVRSRLGRDVTVLRRYSRALDGFALELAPEEAERIAGLPGIHRVTADRPLRPFTDAGPAWIGAPGLWDGSQTGGLPGTQGEGMVIGVVDSGIDMDHPAFADVGGDGYDHVNPRGAGSYVGVCNPSDPSYDPAYHCNDKLIGIWRIDPWGGAGDDSGHGTALAAAAAGNHLTAPVPGTSLTRQISGVAPHANLIAYRVCDDGYCGSYQVAAAIDQAVADGVDVLNVSLGGYDYYPWSDNVALALLGAREAGVFVSSAAGNNGPWEGSIAAPANAPWVLAVGASTHNRWLSPILEGTSGGDTTPPRLVGYGFTEGTGTAPIVRAETFGHIYCDQPFPAGALAGKIVGCEVSPYSDGVLEAGNVQAAGAVGVILGNYYDNGYEIGSRSYGLPAVRLDYQQANTLWNWLFQGSGHMARIDATAALISPTYADIVPSFSGRGPSWPDDVVRPDVVAPGSAILAPAPAPGTYSLSSGTSLSSATAAGAAALLLELHPSWTPAEVQSALMTTARTSGLRLSNGSLDPTPFDVGAGRLDLSAAARAGLVLDETGSHFEQADPDLGGAPVSLNLASLGNHLCVVGCSWTRVVRSTLSTTSHWTAAVTPPPGTTAMVVPSSFTLAPGATQTIQVSLTGPPSEFGWSFGSLTLTETGGQAPPALLPIATRWVDQLELSILKAGTGSGRVVSTPAGIDCGPVCSALFPDDDVYVSLAATADPGSAFVGWESWYCDSPANGCSFTLWTDQQVKAYFNLVPPDRALANHVGIKDGVDGPVADGSFKYYYADVTSGSTELVVDVYDLSGEATLYLRFAGKPNWFNYDCYDYDYYGLPNLRCVITNPAPGRWWIGVLGEQVGLVQYSVRASWGNGADQALANGVPLSDYVSNAQPGAGWKYYYADLAGSGSELVVDLKSLSADADLFVRHGAKPDRSNYDCTSANPGPAAERCTLPQAAAGRWWVGVNNFSAGTVTYTAQATWTAAAGGDFYTVTPCRLVDTRTSYPLQSGQPRGFLVAGHCGIPATATAVAMNVTVVDATGGGHITLYPSNVSVPATGTVYFGAAQVRANNTFARLSTDGGGTVAVDTTVAGGGTVQVVLDVTGYFQ